MKIKCLGCDHSEEVTLNTFVTIIGLAMPAGGFWAWTTFLFAGTGFALPIVIAIMSGGVAMLAFKDEIVEWIINKGYKCPSCGGKNWMPISDGVDKKIKDLNFEILDLKAVEKQRKRFQVLYPSFSFKDDAMFKIVRLDESAFLRLEQKINDLHHNPKNISSRENIIGTDIFEIEFNGSGFLYIRQVNDNLEVVWVGDKKSQTMDLKLLKENSL